MVQQTPWLTRWVVPFELGAVIAERPVSLQSAPEGCQTSEVEAKSDHWVSSWQEAAGSRTAQPSKHFSSPAQLLTLQKPLWLILNSEFFFLQSIWIFFFLIFSASANSFFWTFSSFWSFFSFSWLFWFCFFFAHKLDVSKPTPVLIELAPSAKKHQARHNHEEVSIQWPYGSLFSFVDWLVVGFVTSQQNHVAAELQWATPILPKCQDPCFKLVLIGQMWIFIETILEHPVNTKDDQFGDIHVVILSSKLPQCRVFGTLILIPWTAPFLEKQNILEKTKKAVEELMCILHRKGDSSLPKTAKAPGG